MHLIAARCLFAMVFRTVNGHGSQILQQWTWQALLGLGSHLDLSFSQLTGGFCSPDTAGYGSEIRFEGALCFRDVSPDLDTCKSFSNYTGGVLWQCINSMELRKEKERAPIALAMPRSPVFYEAPEV